MNYGAPALARFDLHMASQRLRTAYDRERPEERAGLLIFSIVLDPQHEVVLILFQAYSNARRAGMPADITQSLRNQLKELGGKPVVDAQVRGRHDLHVDARNVGECRGKTLDSRHQAAVVPAFFPQLLDLAAQFCDPRVGDLDQPVDVAGHIAFVPGKPLAQRRQPELQSDVWLDDTVVDVARDSSALFLGCI